MANGTNPNQRSVRLSRRRWLASALAWLCAPARASAESSAEFLVIVHPENALLALERDFVADAFLKNVREWPSGDPIEPADQKPASAVRQAFSRRVLKRSVQAVRRHWQQRIFSGRGLPPPEFDTDQAVVGYVLKHRGAIGYVASATPIGKARVLAVRGA